MTILSRIEYANKESKSVPAYALVFYKSADGNQIGAITKHRITANHTLGLGRIVNAKAVANSINSAAKNDGGYVPTFIPECLLYDSEQIMIWHSCRFVGAMWFRTNNGVVELLVEWPPLLFAVNKKTRSLQVMALATDSRPNMNTRLYHAPLMNIYSSAILCLGTANLPKNLTPSTIPECQSVLIESQFTHVNHANTLRGGCTNSEHLAFWKEKSAMNGAPPKRVKASEMAFTGHRLSDILQGA